MNPEEYNPAGIGNLVSLLNMTHAARVRHAQRQRRPDKPVPEIITPANRPLMLQMVAALPDINRRIVEVRTGLDDGIARSAVEVAEILFPTSPAVNLARDIQAKFTKIVDLIIDRMKG